MDSSHTDREWTQETWEGTLEPWEGTLEPTKPARGGIKPTKGRYNTHHEEVALRE